MSGTSIDEPGLPKSRSGRSFRFETHPVPEDLKATKSGKTTSIRYGSNSKMRIHTERQQHCDCGHHQPARILPIRCNDRRLGLVAKAIRAKSKEPWVKNQPGAGIEGGYAVPETLGLLEDLEALRFHTVGYGCTSCIGNSGLPPHTGRKQRRPRRSIRTFRQPQLPSKGFIRR